METVYYLQFRFEIWTLVFELIDLFLSLNDSRYTF
ncbi:hypothetical protein PEDI_01040 [Persicobacter diffluens]|uniref:Uncharacterized protein n=1 Tax=Persicobacter diffluens TaxID=981 RepID=A0AAN4VV46_9BACT|nr:hypothetical protein PEDI_01040 [Persicobacter diffluens]